MSSYFAAYQPETAVETSLQGFDIPQEFHLFTHRAVSIADGTEVPGRRVVWGAFLNFFIFEGVGAPFTPGAKPGCDGSAYPGRILRRSN